MKRRYYVELGYHAFSTDVWESEQYDTFVKLCEEYCRQKYESELKRRETDSNYRSERKSVLSQRPHADQIQRGHCLGDNFEYATAIIADCDNSDSDDPADWIYPEDIARQLKKLGVKFLMVASRNHLLPKGGKAPRPKFHVYLLLSVPLFDSDKFVAFCEWCIGTFGTDPQVKSKAQKIFGYGNNPNAFVEFWNEGGCIDEILTDADLALYFKSAKRSKAPSLFLVQT